MYNLLIVDDERFAAEGIRGCHDWRALGIEEVRLAFSAEDAKKILSEWRIDVLICDIEMPDEDGLSLVRWVRERSPHTESIFLTCHSDFQYAKEAVHLGSFEYLLKPVDAEELAAIVGRALDSVKRKEEQLRHTDRLQKYYALWNKQQPLLAERFWKDLLSRRILTFGDFLDRALADAQIELTACQPVLPILVSIEEWRKEQSARDQEIMEYAVKKAAEEWFLGTEWKGEAVLDGQGGVLYVLVYSRSEAEAALESREGAAAKDVLEPWEEAAKRFIGICEEYFYCQVSCYIGSFTPLQELSALCAGLSEMERNNVRSGRSVFRYSAAASLAGREGTASAVPPRASLDLSDMATLLGGGNRQKILDALQRTIVELKRSSDVSPRQLDAYRHDLLQGIYHFLTVRGLHVHDVPNLSAWSQARVRTLSQFESWATNLATAVLDAAFGRQESEGFVQKAIHYMKKHVEESISREDVAAHVSLNPAYLTRLFKKETGKSLIDYLIETKMERGRQLLELTDLTVSAIAQQVGYANFSHFTKMFKKQYGVNPQDYRQRSRG